MLSFAGGLLILTACMKIIEGIDSTKIGQSFTGLIGIMVVMAAFAVLLAKYAPALSANSIFLVSFSASVLLMVYALDKLTTVDMEAVRNYLESNKTLKTVALVVDGKEDKRKTLLQILKTSPT